MADKAPRAEIGPYLTNPSVFDNREFTLEGVWEELAAAPIESIQLSSEVENHVNSAKGLVGIISPSLGFTKSMQCWDKATKRDIGIYALVDDIQSDYSKKNVPQSAHVRELKNKAFLAILADPKRSDSSGLIALAQSGKVDEMRFLMQLTKHQTRELWVHFVKAFWLYQGKEIVKGTLQSSKRLLPEIKEWPANTDILTMQHISSLMSSHGIDSITATVPQVDGLSKYLKNETEISVPLATLPDALKRGWNPRIVQATQAIPDGIALVGINSISYLLFGPYVIRLTSDQKENLRSIFIEEFVRRDIISIEKLARRIIKVKENEVDFIDVLDFMAYGDLSEDMLPDPILTNSFEEWENSKEKNDLPIPAERPISRKIEYKWIVHPPYLPKECIPSPEMKEWQDAETKIGTQKRSIVVQHSALKNAVKKRLDKFSQNLKLAPNLEDAIVPIKEVLESTHRALVECDERIHQLNDGDGRLGRDIEKSIMCVDQIVSESMNLDSILIAFQNKYSELFEKVRNQLNSTKKGKNVVMDASLKEFLSLKPLGISPLGLPNRALPRVGNIYIGKSDKQVYLAIKYSDEIEIGIEECRRMAEHPKLVVERKP